MSVNKKQTPWVVVSTHRMMLWASTDTRPGQVSSWKAGAERATPRARLHSLSSVHLGRQASLPHARATLFLSHQPSG